jgi:hypothetical protein
VHGNRVWENGVVVYAKFQRLDAAKSSSTRLSECAPTFLAVGSVVCGARALAGADLLATGGSTLLGADPATAGAFMQNLFRQGAFQGPSSRDAYVVECDGEATRQNDRDLGIVNILVGFAPLKPAEFVIIQIQQIAEPVNPRA